MKYKGQKIEGPNEEIIIIPRGTGDDIVLTARAVLDFKEFDDLITVPKPPMRMTRGESKHTPLLNDPKYKKEMDLYNQLRLSWLILTSLKATEDLEWETVDMFDSGTWNNYDEEMRDSGFSNVEIGRIIDGVMIANSLSQEKIDEARKHFLAGQREAAEASSSRLVEAKTTQSGEPANVLELDPKA